MSYSAVVVAAITIMGTGIAASQDIGTWQEIAPLPAARSGMGVVYSEATGKFYAVGGRVGADRNISILEYDPAANTWTEKAHLITGVTGAGAVAAG
ncbi:MAG: kelch repeat-containing protein, partial [Candidatus Aureabacteria bacterium]|nr:kelch repeat-containing protein [Candidatus Auribacterota bacterium]